jgi:CDP-2,3-bis-(O-geranylgeranyl)-sn-glycerol synthase
MWSVQELIDFPVLLMLIAANSAPVFAAQFLGRQLSAPIDGNRSMPDGRPILGSHKTWRGLVTGTLAAGLVGLLVARGFLIGALFGALALTGDLLSSFIKRRSGRTSGESVPLLDQLPEALLPMLALQGALGLGMGAIVGTTLVFAALDVSTARFRR